MSKKLHTDNKWFANKKFGYGWTPVTKQGWALTVAYALYITLATLAFGYLIEHINTLNSNLNLVLTLLYAGSMLVSTVLFLLVITLTSDRPVWSWGSDDKKS